MQASQRQVAGRKGTQCLLQLDASYVELNPPHCILATQITGVQLSVHGAAKRNGKNRRHVEMFAIERIQEAATDSIEPHSRVRPGDRDGLRFTDRSIFSL